MAISLPETGVWRFDAFVLDTQRYELRSAGEVIRVEPQVFDVLTQLVAIPTGSSRRKSYSTPCGAGASWVRPR